MLISKNTLKCFLSFSALYKKIFGDQKNKDFLPYPATIDFTNPKVPMVNFGAGKGSSPGLISGMVTSPYEPSQIKCPFGTPGHWDHWIFYTSGNGGLSKDKLGRFGHVPAVDLARKQIKHEWCRLVNLVKQNSGDAGVNRLFDVWVADKEKAQCTGWKGTFVLDAPASLHPTHPADLNGLVGSGSNQHHQGNFDFSLSNPSTFTQNADKDGSTIAGNGRADVNADLCVDEGKTGINDKFQETFLIQGQSK